MFWVALMLFQPTAMHAIAETHDTPESQLPVALGLGLGTTDQLVPFQDSISVAGPLPVLPTAVHALAEMHDTPSSSLNVAGLGLGTTDQTRVCALVGRLTAAAVVTLTAMTPILASA